MNKHAAWLLFVPMVAWANELPPLKTDPTPIKSGQASAAPSAIVKSASKHAAPQQMAEPIKIAKPSTAQAATAEPQPTVLPEILKPNNPPVVRYVSPQFSSARAVANRPVVRSKAPTVRNRAPSAKSTTSYAIKPGLVRVLPASKIPSSAILPPQIQWSAPANSVMPNSKSTTTWGAMEPDVQKAPEVAKTLPEVLAAPVSGRKIASPKYYSETNPEQRWQYYSYP